MLNSFSKLLLLILCSVTQVAFADEGPSGVVTLSQDSFHIEQKSDFEWNYTVGPRGFKPGWVLLLTDPVFHGIRWSKWGDLTTDRTACTPANSHQQNSWGYITAVGIREGSGQVVDIAVDRSNCIDTDGDIECNANAHENAYTAVYLAEEASLQAGDTIRINIGDREGCAQACRTNGGGDCSYCDDCGFEMPDRSFPQITWPAAECFNADDSSDCTDLIAPTFTVTSLTTTDSVYVTVPSQGVVGEPFAIKAALLDARGNAVESSRETLELILDELPQLSVMETQYELAQEDEGWHDFTAVPLETGVFRVPVATNKLEGLSNPIEISDAARTDNIYWGDIHVHHGYTYETPDGHLVDLNHTYARDVVGLDVVSESQKAAGLEIDEEGLWAELQSNCSSYTVDNEYLVLLGWEWMGKFATFVTGEQTIGHHNIYYDSCDGPYGTHDTQVMLALEGQLGIWPWLDLVESLYGIRALTVPHAMRYTGHNYDNASSKYQTLAEIYSEWGDNSTWEPRLPESSGEDTAGTETGEQQSGKREAALAQALRTGEPADTGDFGPTCHAPTSEDAGSTQDMLGDGLRLGWIAASDNHDGWMGNPRSEGNAPAGLGAFIAPALNRGQIFEAMKSRRTYATTGHRPILRFWVEEDGEVAALQGAEIVASAPVFKWAYHGTSTGQRLRLLKITIAPDSEWEILREAMELTPDMPDNVFVADWDGEADEAWWIEVTQDDGYKAWSSPIWITSDCERVGTTASDPLSICPDVDPPTTDTGGDTDNTCGGCNGLPGLPSGFLALTALIGISRRRQ